MPTHLIHRELPALGGIAEFLAMQIEVLLAVRDSQGAEGRRSITTRRGDERGHCERKRRVAALQHGLELLDHEPLTLGGPRGGPVESAGTGFEAGEPAFAGSRYTP